jgi:hypothetical protein
MLARSRSIKNGYALQVYNQVAMPSILRLAHTPNESLKYSVFSSFFFLGRGFHYRPGSAARPPKNHGPGPRFFLFILMSTYQENRTQRGADLTATPAKCAPLYPGGAGSAPLHTSTHLHAPRLGHALLGLYLAKSTF